MKYDLKVLGTNSYGKIFLLKKIIIEYNEIPYFNDYLNFIEKMSFYIIEQTGGFETLILPIIKNIKINLLSDTEIRQYDKMFNILYKIKYHLIFKTEIYDEFKKLYLEDNSLYINKDSFKNNMTKHLIYIQKNIIKYKEIYKYYKHEDNPVDLFDFNLNEFNNLFDKYVKDSNLDFIDKIEDNDLYMLFYKSRFIFFNKLGETIKIPLHLNEGILKSNSNFLRSIEEYEERYNILKTFKEEKKSPLNKILSLFKKN